MLGYSALTLVALVCLNRALKTLSAALAAILAYGQPLFASIFAAILFHELPATSSVIGGAIIIFGLTLATRDKPKSAAIVPPPSRSTADQVQPASPPA